MRVASDASMKMALNKTRTAGPGTRDDRIERLFDSDLGR
jgi:hypothetical protein